MREAATQSKHPYRISKSRMERTLRSERPQLGRTLLSDEFDFWAIEVAYAPADNRWCFFPSAIPYCRILYKRAL
jgi:hypothetical protein